MKVMNFMGFTFSALLTLSMSSVVMASCSSEYDDAMNKSEESGRGMQNQDGKELEIGRS
ncbi:MAG: hypothetical protein IKP51_11025 [Treponema sp.]|nr:hypothetical protein [Treponema sp.]